MGGNHRSIDLKSCERSAERDEGFQMKERAVKALKNTASDLFVSPATDTHTQMPFITSDIKLLFSFSSFVNISQKQSNLS